MYRLVLSHRSVVVLNVRPDYGTMTWMLLRGCGPGHPDEDQIAPDYSGRFVLQPGTYTVVVSRGSGMGPGDFVLTSEVRPVIPDASDSARPELLFDDTRHDVLTLRPRLATAAYRLSLYRPMRVAVRAILDRVPGWDRTPPCLRVVPSSSEYRADADPGSPNQSGSSCAADGRIVVESDLEPGDYVVWLRAVPVPGTITPRGYSLELLDAHRRL